MQDQFERRSGYRVISVVLGEIAVAVVLVSIPLVSSRFGLSGWQDRSLFWGAAFQVVGVFLTAWPDLERFAAFQYKVIRSDVRKLARESVRRSRRSWRRSQGWMRNKYRKLRGRGQVAFGGGVAMVSVSGMSGRAQVRGTGTVEERLGRIENRVAELPSRWRADMQNLRDQRVQLRWYGVPLIIIGTVLVAAGSLG